MGWNAYCLQTAEVRRVEGTREARGRRTQTLHQERDTESIESIIHEELKVN